MSSQQNSPTPAGSLLQERPAAAEHLSKAFSLIDVIEEAVREYKQDRVLRTIYKVEEAIDKHLPQIQNAINGLYALANAAASQPLELLGVPTKPWGDEPWEEYIGRQREKAQYLQKQNDSLNAELKLAYKGADEFATELAKYQDAYGHLSTPSKPAASPSTIGGSGGEQSTSAYLPGEVEMKSLGYSLYLPDPEKPYPAYVSGERSWEKTGADLTDFIKVYHQYGTVWIGRRYHEGHPTSTVYKGALSDQGFFIQLLRLNGRYPL